MTKKDFQMIADVIASLAHERTREAAAYTFARRLERDYPRFDRATFLRACGVEA